jgi:glycosyltransferase involved in cell wall biosynthesis
MQTNKENPKITVIITAYKRKDFIKEAVLSALNQTISKDKYEILCVVGFKDEVFSSFLKDNNIKEFYCDGTYGERLITGLMHSNGEIIVFLEDDDLFKKDKLENVLKAFESTGCVYYHNNIDLIDKNSKEILKKVHPYYKQIKKKIIWNPPRGINKIIRQRGDFNMSSIAFLKNDLLKYRDILVKINASPDTTVFYLLLQNNKPFFFDTKRLTLYRVHESSYTNLINDLEDFKKIQLRFYQDRLFCYQNILNIKIKRLFYYQLLNAKLTAYISGAKDLKPMYTEVIKTLYAGLTIPSTYYIKLSIATLIYNKFPKFVEKYINKKLRNNINTLK